jgi:hypothetical protein
MLFFRQDGVLNKGWVIFLVKCPAVSHKRNDEKKRIEQYGLEHWSGKTDNQVGNKVSKDGKETNELVRGKSVDKKNRAYQKNPIHYKQLVLFLLGEVHPADKIVSEVSC